MGSKYKSISMLALLFLVIGTTIYCTNNPALPMLQITRQYALATIETQKALLLNAGQTLLLRGEDFTPGFFMGFFLQHLAGFMMCILMLKSQLFKRGLSIIGILGFTLMSIFLIWSTFIPVGYFIAMMISMVGGLFLMIWYLLISIQLFRL
jgi:hypothetical protein